MRRYHRRCAVRSVWTTKDAEEREKREMSCFSRGFVSFVVQNVSHRLSPVHKLLPLLALLVLAACAPTSEGRYSLTVITQGQHTLASSETWPGHVYVLGGELTVPAGAGLGGSLSLLGGRARVDGRVAGDVVVLDGAARLGPTAEVGGGVRQGGGTLDLHPQAVVQGGVAAGSGLRVPSGGGWLGGAGTRDVVNGLVQALVVAVAAYGLARYLPRPLGRVTEAVTRYPVVAGAVGLLAGVVGLVLLVLLAFTIVLIPVAFVGGFVLLLAVVYGWAACGVVVGRWLARRTSWRLTPPVAASAGAFLLLAVSALLRPVPVLTDVAALGTVAVGLGAVLLTRFGLRAFVPSAEVEAAEMAYPPPDA